MSLRPDVVERAIAMRREIHRHPELGFEEERTAALVERELDELGIEHRRVAKTGVVGVIRGAHAGTRRGAARRHGRACRSTSVPAKPFASEVPGKMHACGHDAHTAMLLGAARDVAGRARRACAGTAVLLFQPAEEGPGGALPMIEAGALDDPRVDAVDDAARRSALADRHDRPHAGLVNAAADDFYVDDRRRRRPRRVAAQSGRRDPVRGRDGAGVAESSPRARPIRCRRSS